jgi:fumarate reductase subunit D
MIARTARHQDCRKNLHRNDLLWLAALLHRLSGLGLAAFLPLHFLTLGLAVDGEARLESFLRWSDAPAVKIVEAVLMFLLAVHALGGVRLLAVENLAWHEGQKRNAVLAAVVAAAVAIVFLAWIF